MEKQNKVDRR